MEFPGTSLVLLASKTGVKPLIRCVVAIILFLAAVLISTVNTTGLTLGPGPGPGQTPYSLLGVTTTSSPCEITEAYHNLAHTWLRAAFGKSRDLTPYRNAYETLTSPLQRCLYHRDNGIPDWYGVPRTCWGEISIEKLQAMKPDTQAEIDPAQLNDWVTETGVVVQSGGRTSPGAGQDAAPGSAKHSTDCSIVQEEFWISPWTMVLSAAQGYLSWWKDRARELALSPTISLLLTAIKRRWVVLVHFILALILLFLFLCRPGVKQTLKTAAVFWQHSLTLRRAAFPGSGADAGDAQRTLQFSLGDMIGAFVYGALDWTQSGDGWEEGFESDHY